MDESAAAMGQLLHGGEVQLLCGTHWALNRFLGLSLSCLQYKPAGGGMVGEVSSDGYSGSYREVLEKVSLCVTV
ncbi:hypothetical protein R3Q08_26975 [Rhodococcus erythropolis]|uniref:hypothetical protein n=1 Tax=Rhodococcus erythropolis TaxID=1833 RepID=UPI00294A69B0|nr:hypothetical protein [Rhodococcus erythropolis]MDV6211909.1 hypothetical protein [Rhodococcus erythropolis]